MCSKIRHVQIKFERNKRRLLAGITARSEPIQALSAEPMSESDSDAKKEKQCFYKRLGEAVSEYPPIMPQP